MLYASGRQADKYLYKKKKPQNHDGLLRLCVERELDSPDSKYRGASPAFVQDLELFECNASPA